MKSHASSPQDEIARLQAVIHRQELKIQRQDDQIERLKANIRDDAVEPVSDSGGGRTHAFAGAQLAKDEADIAEPMTEPTTSETALTPSRRLLRRYQEVLELANKERRELEGQRRYATEAMTSVVEMAHSPLLKLKEENEFGPLERDDLLRDALGKISATGRDFLNTASRILEAEGLGPNKYTDLVSPTPKSAQNVTTPAQRLTQSQHQPKTMQAFQAAPELENKPASGSEATSTRSAHRQQPRPFLPSLDMTPPTFKAPTVPPAHGPPKPQLTRGSQPAPKPKAQPESGSNSRSVLKPSTPAAGAESFPALASSLKPDLASSGPAKLPMPNTDKVNPKPAVPTKEEILQRALKKEAEGKVPVHSPHWQKWLDNSPIARRQRQRQARDDGESEESGPSAVTVSDEEGAGEIEKAASKEVGSTPGSVLSDR